MAAQTSYIRPATLDDAQDILDIYGPYVLETAITFEYTVPTVEEMRDRMAKIMERYPFFVSITNGQISGYAYGNVFKDRAAYDWAAETTIYVKQGMHREGLGSMLYDALEEALRHQGIVNLYACVAYPQGTNEYLTMDSVLFHEARGYETVGSFHMCGFKFGNWYDMIWMEKIVGEHVSMPAGVIPFEEAAEEELEEEIEELEGELPESML